VVADDLDETELPDEPDSTDDSERADDGDKEEGEMSWYVLRRRYSSMWIGSTMEVIIDAGRLTKTKDWA
jgi:hypothetical protein